MGAWVLRRVCQGLPLLTGVGLLVQDSGLRSQTSRNQVPGTWQGLAGLRRGFLNGAYGLGEGMAELAIPSYPRPRVPKNTE